MWLRVRLGDTVVEVDGSFTDIARFAAVDTQLKIRGPGTIDPRTQKPVVCLSCHDPHGTAHPMFLVAAKERALCIQCHKALR